jgi:hypothetical protein
MKKLILLATAALLITGITFAEKGKKKKCCEKTSSCCSKAGKTCKKDKDKEKTETVKETTVKL